MAAAASRKRAKAATAVEAAELEDEARDPSGPVVVQDLLDLQASLLATVTAGNTQMAGALSTQVGGLVSRVQKEMHDGFARQEARIDDMETRLASLEGAAPRVKQEIKALFTGLAVAEAAAPCVWVPPDFDRAPIPGLLQVRLASSVSLEAMQKVVNGLLGECSVKEEFVQVRGKTVDKVFKVQFAGAEGLAAKRANQFMGLQRDDSGWRTITVPDAENPAVSHKAFFDLDKSRKQIRTEILAKKAASVLRTLFPTERIHVRRQEGKLVLDQVPLLHVVVTSADEYELKWNLALLASRKWDKAQLQAAVETTARSADMDIEWG
jgi:hypothetical protein